MFQAQDDALVSAHHLSRYRFGHVLFRDWLYRKLSPGERRLLHRQIGTPRQEL